MRLDVRQYIPTCFFGQIQKTLCTLPHQGATETTCRQMLIRGNGHVECTGAALTDQNGTSIYTDDSLHVYQVGDCLAAG